VAPFCIPSCQGSGWPAVAASAAPAEIAVTPTIMNATNRLSTSIVQCAPSTRKTACSGPFFAAHHWHDGRRGPAEHGICHGRGSLGGAAGRGKIPASQTIIPALPQCTSLCPVCDKRRTRNPLSASHLRALHVFRRSTFAGSPCLTGPAGHDPTTTNSVPTARRFAYSAPRQGPYPE